MRALYTAATGMNAQQIRTDAIANNIANSSTVGFKKSRAEFQDLFYETLRAPGAESSTGTVVPAGIQVGHGVQLSAVSRVHATGDKSASGRDLDFAIEGDGFFQVEKGTGETVYTRAGNFQLDRDGNLVTADGFQLIPNIQIPVDAVQVTVLSDGTVSVLESGSTSPNDVGQIELARFANPAGLRAIGGNLFVPSESSGDAETGAPDEDGFGAVSQGFLEGSNVNVSEELVKLILAQRGFEMNSRVLQAGDEMMQRLGALSR
ncbi:MAG: flagellar basal-body rod protein FlgG [Myxococcota bacterium]